MKRVVSIGVVIAVVVSAVFAITATRTQPSYAVADGVIKRLKTICPQFNAGSEKAIWCACPLAVDQQPSDTLAACRKCAPLATTHINVNCSCPWNPRTTTSKTTERLCPVRTLNTLPTVQVVPEAAATADPNTPQATTNGSPKVMPASTKPVPYQQPKIIPVTQSSKPSTTTPPLHDNLNRTPQITPIKTKPSPYTTQPITKTAY